MLYVYTNSKVIAVSKEKDKKKWYQDNVESEDSEGLVSEDEDGKSISNDGDAMNYDMHNSDEEMFKSPNQNNEDFGVNNEDMYEF